MNRKSVIIVFSISLLLTGLVLFLGTPVDFYPGTLGIKARSASSQRSGPLLPLKAKAIALPVSNTQRRTETFDLCLRLGKLCSKIKSVTLVDKYLISVTARESFLKTKYPSLLYTGLNLRGFKFLVNNFKTGEIAKWELLAGYIASNDSVKAGEIYASLSKRAKIEIYALGAKGEIRVVPLKMSYLALFTSLPSLSIIINQETLANVYSGLTRVEQKAVTLWKPDARTYPLSMSYKASGTKRLVTLKLEGNATKFRPLEDNNSLVILMNDPNQSAAQISLYSGSFFTPVPTPTATAVPTRTSTTVPTRAATVTPVIPPNVGGQTGGSATPSVTSAPTIEPTAGGTSEFSCPIENVILEPNELAHNSCFTSCAACVDLKWSCYDAKRELQQMYVDAQSVLTAVLESRIYLDLNPESTIAQASYRNVCNHYLSMPAQIGSYKNIFKSVWQSVIECNDREMARETCYDDIPPTETPTPAPEPTSNGGGGEKRPSCGDGICESGEESYCAYDCDVPFAICGDGICETGEPTSCPTDCGMIS